MAYVKRNPDKRQQRRDHSEHDSQRNVGDHACHMVLRKISNALRSPLAKYPL